MFSGTIELNDYNKWSSDRKTRTNDINGFSKKVMISDEISEEMTLLCIITKKPVEQKNFFTPIWRNKIERAHETKINFQKWLRLPVDCCIITL